MNKTLYMGLPTSLNYYIMMEYLKKNKEWVQGSRYPHIAFGYNVKQMLKDGSDNHFYDFVVRNNFYCYHYNLEAGRTIESIAGYENIVIGDAFTNISPNTDDYHIQLRKLVTKLGKQAHRIYVVLPDYIFEPSSEKVYNNNDYGNSLSTLRMVALNVFLDSYVRLLRDYHKHSIYRIIVPQTVQNEDLNKFCWINLDLYKYTAESHPMNNLKRNTITYKNLAEYFYKIHEESLPKNYIIGTGDKNLYSLNQVAKKRSKKVFEGYCIKLDDSFTSDEDNNVNILEPIHTKIKLFDKIVTVKSIQMTKAKNAYNNDLKELEENNEIE